MQLQNILIQIHASRKQARQHSSTLAHMHRGIQPKQHLLALTMAKDTVNP